MLTSFDKKGGKDKEESIARLQKEADDQATVIIGILSLSLPLSLSLSLSLSPTLSLASGLKKAAKDQNDIISGLKTALKGILSLSLSLSLSPLSLSVNPASSFRVAVVLTPSFSMQIKTTPLMHRNLALPSWKEK